MGKDWLVWDVISDDRRRAFKYFVANFGNFCKMEDLVNPVDRQKINYLSSSYLQWSQHYLGEEPIIQRTHSFLSQFHQVRHMNPAPKEIFVELDLSPNPSRSNHHMLRFQVDFGCSCNTIHSIDPQQLLQATIEPFAAHHLDYSKTIIPTQAWTSLNCTHRGKSYELVALIIAAQKYYAPLLGLPGSIRMGILNYDVDTVQQLQTTSGITLLPLGE